MKLVGTTQMTTAGYLHFKYLSTICSDNHQLQVPRKPVKPIPKNLLCVPQESIFLYLSWLLTFCPWELHVFVHHQPIQNIGHSLIFTQKKNVELQETSCELTSAQSLVSACQPNTN